MDAPKNTHPPALPAMNQWSCALACVSYLTKISQEDLFRRFENDFAAWKTMPGVMTRGYLMDMMFILCGFRHFYHSPDWDELKQISDKRSGDRAIFVFRRKDTNHTYLVLEVSEDDTGREFLTVMKPDIPQASIEKVEVRTLCIESDCDFLLFSK